MTDLVWMKVYIGTEAARTADLTPEEFGAYERLRRQYWVHEGLPDDDRRLMRIAGVDADRWGEVRSAICGLFEEGWRLPALDVERDDAAGKRERKIAAGRKGAEKRWDGKRNGSANTSANGYAMAEDVADLMGEPMADALDNQWPSASALEHSLYEERLAPTQGHARTREPDTYLDAPESEDEARSFLKRNGLGPKGTAQAITKLMAGRLERAVLDQIAIQCGAA